MFTYYTIIGRDPKMIKQHLDNVCNYAGFNKIPEDKRDLLVIVYANDKISKGTTNKIAGTVIEGYGGRVYLYNEPDDNFLTNLYSCWNLGYEHAEDGWVFRGGSDQIYSKDSMLHLYNQSLCLDDKIIIQANTIENKNRSPESRHMLADLGDDYDSFDYEKFEVMCHEITHRTRKQLNNINDSLKAWGKPTELMSSLGRVHRTDGCSWLMTKADWLKYGPLPPLENGVTGDVIIHDRMQLAGYRNVIMRDLITYHFVRGESANA
jgi:hypothetical protein